MQFLVAILALVTIFFTSTPVAAQSWRTEFKNFGGCAFERVPNMQPKSMQLVADPVDPKNPNKVLAFSVVPKECIGDDCSSQSARSAVKQCQEGNHPREIWYGWEMFLPQDFPHDGQQIRGFQQFAEWKDQDQCGIASTAIDSNLGGKFLNWVLQMPKGKDCLKTRDFPLGLVSTFLGKWTKFELFAIWSEDLDGRFELYVDGVKMVDFTGQTCTNCSNRNQALFGNYLCCTPDSKKVLPSTVYYRSISSAKTREQIIWE
jgi:hypothetical protein